MNKRLQPNRNCNFIEKWTKVEIIKRDKCINNDFSNVSPSINCINKSADIRIDNNDNKSGYTINLILKRMLRRVTRKEDKVKQTNLKDAYKIYLSDSIKKMAKHSFSLIDFSVLGPLALALEDKIFLYNEKESNSSIFLIYSLDNSSKTSLIDVTTTVNNSSKINLNSIKTDEIQLGGEKINNIKFNCSGDKLFIVSSNGRLEIFDLVTMKLIKTFDKYLFKQVESSNTSNFQLTCSAKINFYSIKDQLLNLDLRINSHTSVTSLERINNIDIFSLSINDKQLALTTQNDLFIVDNRNLTKNLQEIKLSKKVNNFSWSNINPSLLVSSSQNEISFWNTLDYKKEKKLVTEGEVNKVKFNKQNNNIVYTERKNDIAKVFSWDFNEEKIIEQFNLKQSFSQNLSLNDSYDHTYFDICSIQLIDFTLDLDKLIGVASDSTFRVWNIKSQIVGY